MKTLLALLLLCSQAPALVRMAVVFGNNSGLAGEKPLQYATRDAAQVHATLLQLGGLAGGDGYLLSDMPVDKVLAVLREVSGRIRALRSKGEKVQLLIYYSGHGGEEALHMNGKKLPIADIRKYFLDSQADLKILIADACFSGSLIQAKGAALSDPVPVKYRDELQVNGSAILTSSSAGELSQESRDLEGSLFTHFFLTALRGAADSDGDGQVTLWEAYNYTRAGLHRKLASSREAPQTPEFDVDIHGSDNVVLTRVRLGEALLSLKGLPSGEYRVLDAISSRQIAEVNLVDPESIMLALPRGPYLVYRSAGDGGAAGFADLRRSRQAELGPGDFRAVAPGSLVAKGILGPRGLARLERSGYQLSVDSRLYPDFPGRISQAMALEFGTQGNRGDWAARASFLYLSRYRSEARGVPFEQYGFGGSGGIRYFWNYSRLGAAFVGPRLEAWSLGQILDGQELSRGRLLGAFGTLGWEKSFPFSLGLALSFEGGVFFSSDPAGRLRHAYAFPVSLSLRYGR